MKCPVCSGKLDFNLKNKSATCHTCGWHKIWLSPMVTSTRIKRNGFNNTKLTLKSKFKLTNNLLLRGSFFYGKGDV